MSISRAFNMIYHIIINHFSRDRCRRRRRHRHRLVIAHRRKTMMTMMMMINFHCLHTHSHCVTHIHTHTHNGIYELGGNLFQLTTMDDNNQWIGKWACTHRTREQLYNTKRQQQRQQYNIYSHEKQLEYVARNVNEKGEQGGRKLGERPACVI